MEIEIRGVPYTAIYGYMRQALITNINRSMLMTCLLRNLCVPGLASDKNLAGVHDTAGQACSVDGAQSRAELDNVGPDQRLGEQTCMLPWRGRFMLSCTQRHALSHKRNLKGWTLLLN